MKSQILSVESVTVLKKTKGCLETHQVIVTQLEAGKPVICHTLAFVSLRWADQWRSIALKPDTLATFDTIGDHLANL